MRGQCGNAERAKTDRLVGLNANAIRAIRNPHVINMMPFLRHGRLDENGVVLQLRNGVPAVWSPTRTLHPFWVNFRVAGNPPGAAIKQPNSWEMRHLTSEEYSRLCSRYGSLRRC
jgi:hypothetical protein